ncbi:exodeoxyribonuclease VII small subunit [Jeongeupia sp. HS-3]|uniref:exodeoxyribonuclease VII small subunit n=1 Tax=Jeongeupia sp. HS-3 TaxID=1009682 RepID=UPI001910720A|nr:exodeoxyribonuclease VII small subunit [Jeongeupia sp. HS-3]
MPKAAKATAATPVDFETGLRELETLIAELEAGNLSLDAALNAYQRGQTLLGFCQGKLTAAEQQLKVLEAGQLKPFQGDPE